MIHCKKYHELIKKRKMTYIEGLKKDVMSLEAEYKIKKAELQKLYEKLDSAKVAYQRVCTHEIKKEVKINEPGGYDYTARYHTDTYCTICGAFLGRTTVKGGYE
jgi:regulator of replication initiation timing